MTLTTTSVLVKIIGALYSGIFTAKLVMANLEETKSNLEQHYIRDGSDHKEVLAHRLAGK